MGLWSADDFISPVIGNLRIVLVGKTGSGKSATGNTILGKKAFTTDLSPSSVTKYCKKQTGCFDKRIVNVIDTPGIFDTSIVENQLKSEIVECIKLSLPGPHIFLLVIRLDVRFTEEEKNAVKWINKNFGKEASSFTLVVFTRGDELGEECIEAYLNKSPVLKDFIDGCTAGCIVFDNKRMENRTQVADLFERIDQIVQKNGNYYTSHIYKEVQRKMESDEWWNECGDSVSSAGNSFFGTAVLAAVIRPMIGSSVAVTGSALMFAGAGICKAVGWLMKSKKEKGNQCRAVPL